ncbi:hypothetical protein EM595_0894 [Duffyella gerundensis]|uniref:Uncharacterized protein n=1 Tax=Duffyella gerundensis TaxID=1619313 RepID=A0A0U5KY25_9GAMM|nr:hypothetical protein EM595_0894 [Duffyella gerundensis]
MTGEAAASLFFCLPILPIKAAVAPRQLDSFHDFS